MTSRPVRDNEFTTNSTWTSAPTISSQDAFSQYALFSASSLEAISGTTALTSGSEQPGQNANWRQWVDQNAPQQGANLDYQVMTGPRSALAEYFMPAQTVSSSEEKLDSPNIRQIRTQPCPQIEFFTKVPEPAITTQDFGTADSAGILSSQSMPSDNVIVARHNFFSSNAQYDGNYSIMNDALRRRSASSATISSEVPSLEGYPSSRDMDEDRQTAAVVGDLASILGVNPYQKSSLKRVNNRERYRSSTSARQSVHVSPRIQHQSDTQQQTNFYHKTPSRMTTPFAYNHSPPSISRFSYPETPVSYPGLSSPVTGEYAMPVIEPVIHSIDYDFGPELSTDTLLNSTYLKQQMSNTVAQYSLPMSMTLPDHHTSIPVSSRVQSLVEDGEEDDDADHPDIFASARCQQSQPPPEDMLTDDVSRLPREQDLRFEGDLYTPRWVRGHGHKREGWCGMCTPGRWLILKNSAFWYDKSFSHGVFAGTGTLVTAPAKFRRSSVDNPDVWDGFCSCCSQWITLTGSKRIGTSWFRHVAKCQSAPKGESSSKKRKTGGHFRSASTPLQSGVFTPPQTPFPAPQPNLHANSRVDFPGLYRSHSTAM